MTMSNEDQFQVWLIDMDDAIKRFRQTLSKRVDEQLDYSAESLNVIESFALKKYGSVAEVMGDQDSRPVDAMARYVGEVFRKHCGGKWVIDYSDPKDVYHGVPQLSGMAGQRTPVCPLSLVTASADRRTGTYLKGVFDAYQEDAASARQKDTP